MRQKILKFCYLDFYLYFYSIVRQKKYNYDFKNTYYIIQKNLQQVPYSWRGYVCNFATYPLKNILTHNARHTELR